MRGRIASVENFRSVCVDFAIGFSFPTCAMCFGIIQFSWICGIGERANITTALKCHLLLDSWLFFFFFRFCFFSSPSIRWVPFVSLGSFYGCFFSFYTFQVNRNRGVGDIEKNSLYILSVQCVVFSIFCQNTLLHTFATEFISDRKRQPAKNKDPKKSGGANNDRYWIKCEWMSLRAMRQE